MMVLLRSFVVPSSVVFCVVLITISGTVNARAVNISNTWILPEEGFPVFYRYFRDRISWYEADAVCQFHHANLVTVDTTAQYDAARAYLKELDIMSNVWIGLIKSNEEGDFTWTDYKPLTGEGYWAAAPEEGRTPLCTALDPAKDYRWSANSCGGPQVASFICELPVPTWALKPEGGCLVKSLPSLTVQFLPELAAVQLISDCGLDGTKKVTCRSNESHSDVLKELSCTITEDDFSDNQVTVGDSSSSGSSNPSHADTSTFTTTGPGDYSTRSRRETIPTSPPTTLEPTTVKTTNTPETIHKITEKSQPKPLQTIPVQVIMSLPTVVTSKPQVIESTPMKKESTAPLQTSTPHSEITDESLVSENPTKPSIAITSASILSTVNVTTTEKQDLFKILPINTDKKTTLPIVVPNTNAEKKTRVKEHHDIYTVPTDHFIPPLVMAKSKVSTDMTVVSLEEKHLQQKINHNQNKQIKVEQIETVKKQESSTAASLETTTKVPISTTAKPAPTTIQKVVTPKPKPLIVQPPMTSTTAATTTAKLQDTTPSFATEKNNENIIDTNEAKVRKPGKGKKYDKYKEEKKKYKDGTLPNKSEDLSSKVVSVTIPNVGVKTTPLTVIEITTKSAEVPMLSTTAPHTSTEKNVVTNPTETHADIQKSTTQVTSNTTANNTKVDNKDMLIDPNLLVLNKVGNANINNESETIQHDDSKTSTIQPESQKEKMINTSNKTVNKPTQNEMNSPKTTEVVEPTPDPIPKPNRSRTLTQPSQHRSFYPYFFNRVLG